LFQRKPAPAADISHAVPFLISPAAPFLISPAVLFL
jgi:hypothetical protein